MFMIKRLSLGFRSSSERGFSGSNNSVAGPQKYQCIFTKCFPVLGLVILTLFSSCSRDRRLTVVSYGGGAYQKSHQQAFCEPFGEKAGIQTASVVWNANYGKLKTMVESGRVTWDVVEVTAAQFRRGKKESLFEPLADLPDERSFIPETVDSFGVANVYWGTVLAYKLSEFRDKKPSHWSDFWDVKEFPGHRAMYDDPRGNLEFALLADGVVKDSLYPLDVNRAFKKLDEIKPHVRIWWTDGTQPVQLLLTGAVVMTTAWNGRIYASEQARDSIGYTWSGAALELDYWVIPKGSKHIRAGTDFILYASSPRPMGLQAEMVGYGPVNLDALDYVSDSNRTRLPTHSENWKVSYVVDAEWWSHNEQDIKARWVRWKLQ